MKFIEEGMKNCFAIPTILCPKVAQLNAQCGIVSQSYLALVTPWTAASQVPLSMRFPGQEYWSGLPFPQNMMYPMGQSESVCPAPLVV